MNIGTLTIEMAANVARLSQDMEAAKRTVDGAMRDIQKSVSVAKNALVGLGAGLSVGAFAAWVKTAVDAADEMSKLSQKTGIAVKDLAGLQLAYRQSGLEAGALQQSMGKLSVAVVNGSDALKAMGVQTRNADGSLKTTRQVLGDVADRFASYEDGIAKTALAIELFGKSGAELIPMLNGGSAALAEFDEMARKLGLTMDEETARNAEKFNDTLDLVGQGMSGIARQVAGNLLPTLTALAGQFLSTMTEGDKLKRISDALALGLRGLYSAGLLVVEAFSTVGKTVGAAAAQIVAVLQGNFSEAAAIGREWAADTTASWGKALEQIKNAWNGTGDASVEAMAAAAAASKKAAPEVGEVAKAANKTADEFESLRAKIAGKDSGLDADFAKNMQVLRDAFDSGKISLAEFKALAEQYIKQQKFYQDQVKESAAAEEERRKAVERAAEEYAKAIQSAEDMIDQIQFETEALKMTNTEREIAIKLRELERKGIKAGSAEYEEYARRIRDAVIGKEAVEASIEQQRKAEQEWQKTWDQVGQSLTDALMRGFESGKGFARNLRDTVVNMFQTLVLRPVIQAIVAPVAGGLASLFGLPGTPILTGLGQIVGGGKNSNLNMLYSAGTLLPGAEARVFDQLAVLSAQPGLLGDIGLFASNAAGSIARLPGGLIGGSLITGGAGMLGGKLGEAAFGTNGGIASTIGGAGGALLGAQLGSIGGPLGALAGGFLGSAVGGLFGGKKKHPSLDVWVGANAAPEDADVQAIGKSGLEFTGVAKHTNDEGEDAVRKMTDYLVSIDAALTDVTRNAGYAVDLAGAQLTGGKKGRGQFPVDENPDEWAMKFAKSWIDAVSEGFDAELEMTAATLGGDTVDKLVAGFDTMLKLDDRISRGSELFAGVESLSETVGILQSRFADAGEGLADVIARLDTGTALLQAVGEGADNTVEYFERAAMALKGLGTDRAAQITEYGNTLQRINAMLSSDYVIKGYEQSTRSLLEVYRDQTDQIARLTDNLYNEADFAALEAALTQRYDTELQLIGQIESALQSVQASFDATIESIFLDGLKTEQERYEYFRQQADSLAESILSLNDPAQIQAAAQRYNQLVMQAYQRLGEESRDLMREDILATVTEMRDLTSGLLEGVKGDVTSGGGVADTIRNETQAALRELQAAVREAVDTIARQQAESARQEAQLMTDLQRWATSLPSNIRVAISGSEVAF